MNLKKADPDLLYECKICKRRLPLSAFFLTGNGYCGTWCKQCQSDKETIRYHNKNPNSNYIDKTIDPFWKLRYFSIRDRAKQRGISCEITPEDLINQNDLQKGLCYYTGKIMIRPSIDRLDSDQGYIKGNIVFCELEINQWKHTKREKDFIKMCIEVVEYQKRLSPKEGIITHGKRKGSNPESKSSVLNP